MPGEGGVLPLEVLPEVVARGEAPPGEWLVVVWLSEFGIILDVRCVRWRLKQASTYLVLFLKGGFELWSSLDWVTWMGLVAENVCFWRCKAEVLDVKCFGNV